MNMSHFLVQSISDTKFQKDLLAGTNKMSNSKVLVNFRSKSSIGKLPWSMSIKMCTIQTH